MGRPEIGLADVAANGMLLGGNAYIGSSPRERGPPRAIEEYDGEHRG